jgi:hypothetical protein
MRKNPQSTRDSDRSVDNPQIQAQSRSSPKNASSDRCSYPRNPPLSLLEGAFLQNPTVSPWGIPYIYPIILHKLLITMYFISASKEYVLRYLYGLFRRERTARIPRGQSRLTYPPCACVTAQDNTYLSDAPQHYLRDFIGRRDWDSALPPLNSEKHNVGQVIPDNDANVLSVIRTELCV